MDLTDQFRCPTGRQGRTVAARMNREHHNLTTWGLTHVTIHPDHIVLDVGCGGGKTLNRLAQKTPLGKAYGIDYSADMVEYAKKINKKFIEQNRAEINKASADRTGFPNSHFDLVTACETYYFWPSLPDAFRELLRVLKPNGKLLLINEMIKDGIYEVENAQLIGKTHVNLLELKEINLILHSAGFVNIEIHRKEGTAWNVIVAQKPSA